MKSLILVSILSFGLAFQAKSAKLSAQDVKDIEAASKEWVKAYNKNDWNGLADLFALNATMMPPNSVAIIGRQDIASWQEKYERLGR